jgi:hypothetical protein
VPSDDEDEQLAALNDERDRLEIRDAFNRELLEHELRRLAARMRNEPPKEK